MYRDALRQTHVLKFTNAAGKPFTLPVCRCREDGKTVYRSADPLITGVIVAVEERGALQVVLPGVEWGEAEAVELP